MLYYEVFGVESLIEKLYWKKTKKVVKTEETTGQETEKKPTKPEFFLKADIEEDRCEHKVRVFSWLSDSREAEQIDRLAKRLKNNTKVQMNMYVNSNYEAKKNNFELPEYTVVNLCGFHAAVSVRVARSLNHFIFGMNFTRLFCISESAGAGMTFQQNFGEVQKLIQESRVSLDSQRLSPLFPLVDF